MAAGCRSAQEGGRQEWHGGVSLSHGLFYLFIYCVLLLSRARACFQCYQSLAHRSVCREVLRRGEITWWDTSFHPLLTVPTSCCQIRQEINLEFFSLIYWYMKMKILLKLKLKTFINTWQIVRTILKKTYPYHTYIFFSPFSKIPNNYNLIHREIQLSYNTLHIKSLEQFFKKQYHCFCAILWNSHINVFAVKAKCPIQTIIKMVVFICLIAWQRIKWK